MTRGLRHVVGCIAPLLLAGCAGAVDYFDDLQDESVGSEESVAQETADDGLGGDAFIPPLSPPDVEALAGCARDVTVTSSAALASAIGSARPGDCIVLADGKYSFPTIQAKGSADKPIVIRAANTLGALVATGNLSLQGAAYVQVQGLHWTSSGNISLGNCDHCRISRLRIERQENGQEIDWVTVSGTSHDCRIDHNDFGPQRQIGNMIMLSGAGAQAVQRTRIDHNFIHDVQYAGGNGWETIRAGLSGWTFSRANTVIEHNLFLRANDDPETISIKSSDNTIRFNTMRATAGQFTLRHGNRSSVYGNYIFGDGVASSGGIRVCGGGHKIFNNYIEGVSGAGISLESGESDDKTGQLRDHKQVYGVQVVFNTIVDSRGIPVGGGKALQPKDCAVANNILQGSGTLLSQRSGTQNLQLADNIVFGGKATMSNGVLKVNPKLARSGGVMRPGSGSPAIDAATTTFTFVSDDIDQNARSHPDIGADEVVAAAPRPGPLTEADVGPLAP
jgi:hypothetical protein